MVIKEGVKRKSAAKDSVGTYVIHVTQQEGDKLNKINYLLQNVVQVSVPRAYWHRCCLDSYLINCSLYAGSGATLCSL